MVFDNDPNAAPNQPLFRQQELINLFHQGKLSRCTLLAGFNTKRAPNRPISSCFFRTLDFLLQHLAAGNNYRAIIDKEEAKGYPPAGWLRPCTVASAEDAPAVLAAATADDPPEQLETFPANHSLRFFFSARSWCYINSFRTTTSSMRAVIGIQSDEMYQRYEDGEFSEWTLVLGLTDPAPPTNTWLPASVMVPLGALMYMHDYNRPYLPLSLEELREIKAEGVAALGPRSGAETLPLPPPVAAYYAAAAAPEPTPAHAEDAPPPPPPPPPAATGGGRAGGRAAASNSGGASSAGAGPSAPPAAGGAAGARAPSPPSGGGGPPPPPPPPEDDPLLSRGNWIMPKPFDAPATSPSPAPDSDGGGGAAASADGAAAPAALQPSPFLQADFAKGVHAAFETPPLRLFMGERAQAALCVNWWFQEPAEAGGATRGPYSPEQMLLAYVAGCSELHEETLVCGTEADLRTPPPAAAFSPLAQLLGAVTEGLHYTPVTRSELLSPLAQRLLGNRTRATPLPMPAAPSPTPAPVMLQHAAPQHQHQQGQQQQQHQPAALPQLVIVSAQQPPTPVVMMAAQPGAAQPAPVVVHAAPGVPFPGAMPYPAMRPMHVLPNLPPGPMMRPRPVGQYVVPSVVYAQPYNPAGLGAVAGGAGVQQQPLYTGGTVLVTPVVAAPPPPPR
ncbi:hypothetical protein HXX76_010087 [Chlamydomonas incerta]|uniref:Uncharacterized protein n=1 Tax=Chlamydomonas incerta TaxID=51695 RepID=A0A835SP11_CHLIN|nr:hypothetical protein HXX76_010087 [Chlamydomonas incerta]|eukprot:KAG2430568.1 hypothetical protein HXX76_010087 [Chlamydomonas incerta]